MPGDEAILFAEPIGERRAKRRGSASSTAVPSPRWRLRGKGRSGRDELLDGQGVGGKRPLHRLSKSAAGWTFRQYGMG